MYKLIQNINKTITFSRYKNNTSTIQFTLKIMAMQKNDSFEIQI